MKKRKFHGIAVNENTLRILKGISDFEGFLKKAFRTDVLEVVRLTAFKFANL